MHTTDESKVTFSQSRQYCEPAPWSRNRRAPRSPLLSLPASTLPKGIIYHRLGAKQFSRFLGEFPCFTGDRGPLKRSGLYMVGFFVAELRI